MRNRLFFLITAIAVLYSATCFGQKITSAKPLVSILAELQDRFQVQFNYASDLLEDIQLREPDSSLELNEVLDYIMEETGLKLVFVSDKIISVTSSPVQLCGYILDKETMEPLPYTTIQSNGRGTVTNDEGYFELPIANISDIVLIRHIGHRTLRREVKFFNTETCPRLYLVPEQQQLPEIVLSDYLIRGLDKLDNGSFQLDFDRFSILPGLVEEDVLQ
ncbi:MAG: carboxypeptidase-like regulatory domain-containing protein, partial [Eudoraea sp.]|nr:carboxypeptidase-like regulatory domain-containing protein [Eudoraea sp.]